MSVFNFIFAQAVVPLESGTATSLMGWAAFVFGLGTFGILVWDRVIGKGKSLAGVSGKIDRLGEQMEDVENTQKVMDGHLETLSNDVRTLTQEWKGFDGTNGARNVLREHTKQIALILERNTKLDAVREIERERAGGQHRRLMDRVMDETENLP